MTGSFGIETLAKLRSVYDDPGAIPLDKVVHRIDRHVSGFLREATFVMVNLRHADGRFVPIMAGGAPGFIRVIDDTTIEFEISATSESDRYGLPDENASCTAGLLLLIPGTRETLRMKGGATLVLREPGQLTMRVQLANIFFHCGKAFIRSKIWDKPAVPGAWKGMRAFVCVSRRAESREITSFEFEPLDRGPLPQFTPGQHISLELDVPGQRAKLRRAYSLSCRPGTGQLRISVKREPHPAVASNYIHDRLKVGDKVNMRSPAGSFRLRSDTSRPIVLIGAGVGLTPLVSMLEHLTFTNDLRPVVYFHCAASSEHHAMAAHVERLVDRHPDARAVTFYTRPLQSDRLGLHYHHRGRISADSIASQVDLANADFYICGPATFMSDLSGELIARGVPKHQVHFETFSPSRAHTELPIVSELDAAADGPKVEFVGSGVSARWGTHYESLLDLAEKLGVPTQSSCRAGSCFSCETRLVAGRIKYPSELEEEPDEGTVLLCCAVPDGDVELDL